MTRRHSLACSEIIGEIRTGRRVGAPSGNGREVRDLATADDDVAAEGRHFQLRAAVADCPCPLKPVQN